MYKMLINNNKIYKLYNKVSFNKDIIKEIIYIIMPY